MGKTKSIKFEGEQLYLKKDFLGVRVVYPPKVDGKLNWFNLLIGGWNNFIMLLFILLLVLGFFYIYHHDTQEMQEVVNNPCDYCLDFEGSLMDDFNIDFSDLKITSGENEGETKES